MIVNFFDSNISHAKSYNQAIEETRHGNLITYNRGKIVGNINLFSDNHVSAVNKFLNSHYINVAWLMEPIDYKPAPYRWVLDNAEKFDLILTHNLDLMEQTSNSVYMPASGIFIDTPTIQSDLYRHKSKMCSFVYSSKNFLPGHNLRHQISKLIDTNNYAVDKFGMGHNPIDKKSEGLKEYMFSLAIENSISRGYFTEKIFDCFATKTIPIYWGDSYLWNTFDKRGAITFNHLTELPDILSDLTIEKYESMKESIDDNWKKCNLFYDVDGMVYNRISEFLGA